MIDDLDATLRAVLDLGGAPAEVRAAEVSFQTPSRDFAPGGPTLNLFLNEVQENAVLRDDRPRRTVVDQHTVAERKSPLWVDCGYLVTAWSARSGDERAAEEHRLLAMAMLWLSDVPVLNAEVAVGALHRSPHPMPVQVARTAEGERLGQFWTALGIAPRPAFSLTVTVALMLPAPDVVLPRPKALRFELAHSADPALSGLVLDAAALTPLPATVTVEGSGLRSTAGADGRFTLRGLDFGTHTLLVQVSGRPDQRVEVEYGARSQIHNVLVTTG